MCYTVGLCYLFYIKQCVSINPKLLIYPFYPLPILIFLNVREKKNGVTTRSQLPDPLKPKIIFFFTKMNIFNNKRYNSQSI